MSYQKKCRRDCPDRKVGCHEECERYAEDCENNRKQREYLQKHIVTYGSTISQRRDQVEKAIRRHRKRK